MAAGRRAEQARAGSPCRGARPSPRASSPSGQARKPPQAAGRGTPAARNGTLAPEVSRFRQARRARQVIDRTPCARWQARELGPAGSEPVLARRRDHQPQLPRALRRRGTASCGSRARTPTLLGIDREAERAADAAAAAAGVGPGGASRSSPRPAAWSRASSRAAGDRRGAATRRRCEVAAALRAIHAGPPLPARFSPFARVARYGATARERGGTIPAAYAEAARRGRRIEAALRPSTRRCRATTTC